MFETALACLLLAVVALKYLKPFAPRCPQCSVRREDMEAPLCSECGWIYESADEDDDYVGEDGKLIP